jgi:DNA-binding PadR family transcriptional regulator
MFWSVTNLRDNIKGGALTETTLLVLLALYTPNHGYGIMKFIESTTSGRVVLGAGTLYGAIQALEKKKWIVVYSNEETQNKKKEYIITGLGQQKVVEELQRIEEIHRLALSIIKGGTNNE